MAPPVMMIGPSAPNGPPVPMAMADESGFRIATLASSRERPSRIASIASGMPWPRIFSLPKRAIRPMISEPTTGTTTAHRPSGESWSFDLGQTEPAEICHVGGKLDQLEQSDAGQHAGGRHDDGDPAMTRTRGLVVKSLR